MTLQMVECDFSSLQSAPCQIVGCLLHEVKRCQVSILNRQDHLIAPAELGLVLVTRGNRFGLNLSQKSLHTLRTYRIHRRALSYIHKVAIYVIE